MNRSEASQGRVSDGSVAGSKAPVPWLVPTPLPGEFVTDGLVIRLWRDPDAAGLYEAVSTSRAAMVPWLPWATYDHMNLSQSVYNIEKWRRECEGDNPLRDNFVMGVFDRVTGAVLGGTGLHRIVHASHEAEIGYWVRVDQMRRGICTEATRGVITWAFLPVERGGWGLRRVHIRCSADNAASKGVPSKIGLRQEVHIKDDRWVDGYGWSDTLGWGVLASEWNIERQVLHAKAGP